MGNKINRVNHLLQSLLAFVAGTIGMVVAGTYAVVESVKIWSKTR